MSLFWLRMSLYWLRMSLYWLRLLQINVQPSHFQRALRQRPFLCFTLQGLAWKFRWNHQNVNHFHYKQWWAFSFFTSGGEGGSLDGNHWETMRWLPEELRFVLCHSPRCQKIHSQSWQDLPAKKNQKIFKPRKGNTNRALLNSMCWSCTRLTSLPKASGYANVRYHE